MDCSTSLRGADEGQSDVPLTRATLPEAAELVSLHAREYDAALQVASTAPERIAAEMRRIRSGEVAHFDFLQYEHLEMMRHARALAHPPVSFEPARREAALAQAAYWQEQAGEYELSIADFLRAQAVASSASANYRDLLRELSVGANEKVLALLATAEQSLLRFRTEPDPTTRLALEEAILALADLGLNPQFMDELQLQMQLLLGSVPAPQV